MKVSIGIPFYNNENDIVDAVKSIYSQSHADWELILVNDGSRDRSLEIVSRIEDARVKVLSDGVNRGLSYRLNQIADEAQYPLLARMDADDLSHPERLRRQVKFMNENPSVDLVDTGMHIISESGSVVGARDVAGVRKCGYSALKTGLLSHATILGKTEWFRRNRYDVNLRRAEDRELWCRTWRSSSFAHLSDPLYYYREYSHEPAKYYRSLIDIRSIIVRHHRIVPFHVAAYLYGRTYLMGLAYFSAVSLGIEKTLIQRRSKTVSMEEGQKSESIMRAMRLTPVPGWDSVT